MVPLPQGPSYTSGMTYQTFINPPNILREYVRNKQCLSISFILLQKETQSWQPKVIEVAMTISISSLTANKATTSGLNLSVSDRHLNEMR